MVKIIGKVIDSQNNNVSCRLQYSTRIKQEDFQFKTFKYNIPNMKNNKQKVK